MPGRSQVHIDKPLTNISVAYMQSASNFIADKVFPIVPVEKQSDRYFKYLKEDWYRDEAQERAPGTESAGGDYDIDNTPTYFCKKYSYHKDVTEEDRVNSDTPLNADRDATEFVSNKLILRREMIWANNYFKTGIWGTEISGGATEDSTHVIRWGNANSTPIQDIHDAKLSIQGNTGYIPNTLVLGPLAYAKLKNHPLILDRIKYTQKGIVTTELLAALFEVDRVMVANAVVNNTAKGTADATQFIFGNNALLCYAAPRPALKTPSAGYIFSWKGLLGAGAFGNRMVRLPMDTLGIGTERIEGEMAFDMRVVSSDLGFYFNDIG